MYFITGKIILNYIDDIRIKEAKLRLAGTTGPVTRICIDTGFENIRTFNRVFKKLTGFTPGEFGGSVAHRN